MTHEKSKRKSLSKEVQLEDIKSEQTEIEELKKEISEVKAEIEAKPKAKMTPWVRGVFNFDEQPGEVLSFIYNRNRLALKDKQKAEIPLDIANHLNSLKYNVLEWVRVEKDSHEGQQGVKKIVDTRDRCSFTIFDHYEMPEGTRVGLKPNQRASA